MVGGLILDIIYPDTYTCLNCGETYLFSEISFLCDHCLSGVKLSEHFCSICGRELESDKEICSFCQEYKFRFDMARSVGIYDGLLKKLLLKFKYEHCLKITRPLVKLLVLSLENYYLSEKIDRLLPVPIHDNRMLLRGFNQAQLIAEGLSGETGIPLSTAVRKTRDIPPLFKYAYNERRDLLKGCFTIEDNIFNGEVILLVDDIFTTGATADEISRLLKEVGGASRILVLTIATACTY